MAEQLLQFLRVPLEQAGWSDLRDFWLARVFADRFVVFYFLPLLAILLPLRRDRLRVGIVLTGLVFVGYLSGAFFAVYWLVLCLALYRLSEFFAHECRRTDVLPWGPPLGAWLVIGLGYLGSFYFARIDLSDDWNAWLWTHAPWVFPLGLRGLAFEPNWVALLPDAAVNRPPALMMGIFLNPHNIGTAYLALRMLNYFSEIKRGSIPREQRSLLNFLSWLCYAPTLMQGPIERYHRFHEELDSSHERRSLRQIPRAAARIGWGMLKGLIALLYLFPIVQQELISRHYYDYPEQIQSYAFLYFGVVLHISSLYLAFSGYCDISAGMARLLGIRQIENFNRPYLATNLRDFWRRWHISLSLLVRDYVYIAMGGNRRHTLLNLFAAFVLIGIWHMPLASLGAWGLLMGVLVIANQRWIAWIKRIDEQPDSKLFSIRRAWMKLQPLPTICAWMITMHFFTHSLLLFFGGSAIWKVTWELIRRPIMYLIGPGIIEE